MLFSRVPGRTLHLPFRAGVDRVEVRPGPLPGLAVLVDPGFQPGEWLVRRSARHRRSGTCRVETLRVEGEPSSWPPEGNK